MFSISTLLLFSSIFNSINSLITCSSCETTNYNCQDTCKGDYCFHTQYYLGNIIYPTIQKGCIIGEVQTEGCRVNHNGNVMCLCGGSDFCNTNLTTIDENDPTITLLGVQTCQPSKLGVSTKPRWVKPCAGNYCTYLSSKVDTEGSNYTWAIKDCNKENEFDLFPTFSVFNFYPGSCAWLTYGGQPNTKMCYGSNDLETTLALDPTIPLIQCQVDYFSQYLPNVRTGGTCSGQFCFISATSQGEVYRGCASVSAIEGATTVKVGYTRSYTGLEQWICNEAYCNADLKSAETSWPPELYLYRNISNLREFNVFYISSSRSNSPFFFAIFLVVIGLFM